MSSAFTKPSMTRLGPIPPSAVLVLIGQRLLQLSRSDAIIFKEELT